MWSRTAAPSPIVVSSRSRSRRDDHARREVAERADSHVVLDDHAGFTIACDPTTAPAFTTDPPARPPGLDAGAGRDPGGGVDDGGQRASGHG
jgi:hypothetical protein